MRDQKGPLVIPKTGLGLPMQIPGPVHLNVVPKKSEPINIVDQKLVTDMIIHDSKRKVPNAEGIMNRVVYDCLEAPHGTKKEDQESEESPLYITKKDGHIMLKPYYTPKNSADNTLVFESRFESGNLRRAIQVYEYEYDLILKFDINTRGHTQWFYFSVSNVRKNVRYKFNIINLLKPDSLYNSGMKPLVYSEADARTKGRGWYRDGSRICYYQNGIKRKGGSFYTFTYSMKFQNQNDTYYFAYCYPYTYTNLQNYLHNLEQDPVRRKLFRRRSLCQTLAGNTCDLLTITSFSGDPQTLKKRKGVVVSARVHPGESNGSWMMKGLIDFLTGPSLDAKILRDNFVFKIVPMLNPDGVINGNYRCSLMGVDLNRKWNEASKKFHPTIAYTKQMIRQFMKEREVILFCDFHGHSRKKNIFMYGCVKGSGMKRLSTRVFPRILWKVAQNFSFKDCSFGVQKSKESTARIVGFKELGLVNSYTMEASFCGSNFGKHCDKHFNTRHLEHMGHYFCEAILDYCDPDPTNVRHVLQELELLYLDITTTKDNGDDSAGSDDEESESTKTSTTSQQKKKKKKKKEKRFSRQSTRSVPTVTQTTKKRASRASSRSMSSSVMSTHSSSSGSSNGSSTARKRSTSRRRLKSRSLRRQPKVDDVIKPKDLPITRSRPVSKQAATSKLRSRFLATIQAKSKHRNTSQPYSFSSNKREDEYEHYKNFRMRLFGTNSLNKQKTPAAASKSATNIDRLPFKTKSSHPPVPSSPSFPKLGTTTSSTIDSNKLNVIVIQEHKNM